jgi:hypothetical protein
VFLWAAGHRLKAAGCSAADLDQHLYGVDIHRQRLKEAMRLLESEGSTAAYSRQTSSTSTHPISSNVRSP